MWRMRYQPLRSWLISITSLRDDQTPFAPFAQLKLINGGERWANSQQIPFATGHDWGNVQSEMPTSGEEKPDVTRPARPPSGNRRRHRGGRGRGRGRSAPLQPAALPAEIAGVAPEARLPAEPAATAPTAQAGAEPGPQGSAISQALAEVMSVVEALKHATEAMDEALELVELAERQKIADEHEIESLRRALRQLQRPRGSGHGGEDDRRP